MARSLLRKETVITPRAWGMFCRAGFETWALESFLSLFLLETMKRVLDILQRLKILRLLKTSERLLCLGSRVMFLLCLVLLPATPPCSI